MDLGERKTNRICHRVRQLYMARYSEAKCQIPADVLDGLVRSVLVGEIQIIVDGPTYWPLSTIWLLLKEVQSEQTSFSNRAKRGF